MSSKEVLAQLEKVFLLSLVVYYYRHSNSSSSHDCPLLTLPPPFPLVEMLAKQKGTTSDA